MLIGGLQKLTLLDFPTKVACTVFTHGCNYRCPFCHNALLVTEKPNGLLSEDEVLSFLSKRKGILDGVCITGGEPLLQCDILPFMDKVKSMGYALKLDTNGSYPDKLRTVLEKGLVDYVAMDIKNSLDKYSATVGVNADVDRIKESVSLLMNGGTEYEFRTTVVKNHHTASEIESIAKGIAGAKRYYLQNFVNSGKLIGEAEGVSEQIMDEMLTAARLYVPNAELRGIPAKNG